MGNHDVGRVMAAAAEAYWVGRGEQPAPFKEEALRVLDSIAQNFHGADAEFDDELDSDTPLCRLLVIEFDATPEEVAARDETEDDDIYDKWWDGPLKRFNERYRFC